MTRSMVVRRVGVYVCALMLGAAAFAGCSSAHAGLGTTDESCYLALPTATKAVGGHGHFAGIRKYTVGGLKGMAPQLYDAITDQVGSHQAVCLAAYTGTFTSGMVTKPLGRSAGKLAVVVVTSPGNKVLGTLILSKIPVRFQHTLPF